MYAKINADVTHIKIVRGHFWCFRSLIKVKNKKQVKKKLFSLAFTSRRKTQENMHNCVLKAGVPLLE